MSIPGQPIPYNRNKQQDRDEEDEPLQLTEEGRKLLETTPTIVVPEECYWPPPKVSWSTAGGVGLFGVFAPRSSRPPPPPADRAAEGEHGGSDEEEDVEYEFVGVDR